MFPSWEIYLRTDIGKLRLTRILRLLWFAHRSIATWEEHGSAQSSSHFCFVLGRRVPHLHVCGCYRPRVHGLCIPRQQATPWPPSDLKVSSQVACPTPRRTARARVPRSKLRASWVTSLGPWTRPGARAPVRQVLLVHTLLSQRVLYVCFLAFLFYFIFRWRKMARGEPVKEPLKCRSQSGSPSCLDLWVEPTVCPAGSGIGLRNGPTIPGTC